MLREPTVLGSEPLKLLFLLKTQAAAVSRIQSRIRSQVEKLRRISQTAALAPHPPSPVVPKPALEAIEAAADSMGRLLETGQAIKGTSPLAAPTRSREFAGKAALAYKAGVSSVASSPVKAVQEATLGFLPVVKGVFDAVATGAEPFVKVAKEPPPPTLEEAVGPPSVKKDLAAAPETINSVRTVSERVGEAAYGAVFSLISAFAESVERFAVVQAPEGVAPTTVTYLERLIEKGYEGLAAATPLTGIPSVVKRGLAEVREGPVTAPEVPRAYGGVLPSLLAVEVEPAITKYRSMVAEASSTALKLIGETSRKMMPQIAEMERGVSRAFPMAAIDALIRGAGEAVRLPTVVDQYTLAGPSLGLPIAPRSLKLHEMASLMSLLSALSQTARSTQLQRPMNVTVRVESLADERDLRELERKIARILRDAARRYGVPL